MAKVIIFHGIDNEEVISLMRLIKNTTDSPKDFIFAVTTEQSLEWRVKDLIKELEEEHEYFKKKEE